jgi:glycosyltransferase involved in cell wall biosynthesis
MKKTVIVPVYNEEGNIGELIDKISLYISEHDEIIIVNDGSIDNTESEIKTRSCVLITLKKNMGKGFAMRAGIEKAKGDYIIFMGGDGQDDPREIDTLLQEVDKGYDYVIGSRFLSKEVANNRYSNKAILPVNEFGNKSITFIINILFKKNITDSQSEFKCFTSEKLKELDLESDRFEIETELLIKSFRKKFKIKEVPVHRYERKHGISKLFNVPFGRFLFGLKVLRTIFKGYLFWR